MLGTSWECHKVREFALRPMGDFLLVLDLISSSRKRTDQFRIHYMLSVLDEAMAMKVNYKISPLGCQNSMIT